MLINGYYFLSLYFYSEYKEPKIMKMTYTSVTYNKCIIIVYQLDFNNNQYLKFIYLPYKDRELIVKIIRNISYKNEKIPSFQDE